MVNDQPATSRVPNKSKNDDTGLALSEEHISRLEAQVDKFFLTGYDCSDPMAITPVNSHVKDPCMDHIPIDSPMKVEGVNRTMRWQVLQYEDQREIKAFRCTKFKTLTSFYCGNADHSTPIPQLSYSKRKQLVSTNDCNHMTSVGQYMTADSKMHSITVDVSLVHSYFLTGSTSAYTDWLGSQVTCTGGKVHIGTDVIDKVVQYVTEEIMFQEERIIERPDGTLVALYDNTRLNCALRKGQCHASLTTYIWDIGTKRHCPLVSVRTFTGVVVHSPASPERVVMSTDQSLLRFILKGQTEVCGLTVKRTNYDKLFELYNEDGTKKKNAITRKIKPNEISMSLFITNHDDVLYHRLKSQVRDEFQAVLRDDCQRNLDSTKLTHYVERELPGFRSYRLGGANYLTKAGEVAYSYKCKPKLILAMEVSNCYSALPVELAGEKSLEKFDKIDGTTVEAPKYFMEPLTHRITQTATQMPCIPRFFSRYVDLFGRWFAVTPTFEQVPNPRTLNVDVLNKRVNFSFTSDDDFSKGGMYTNEEVDSLQRYLELGRVQEAISYKLAEQAGNVRPEDYISPSMLFPTHAIPGGSWSTFVLGKIWGWLRGLGEFTSIVLAILVIVRAFWYLMKVCMNCRYIYDVHGCAPSLAWAFCSEILFTRHYRSARIPQGNRMDNDATNRPLGRGRRRHQRRLNCPSFCTSRDSDSDHNDEVATPLRDLRAAARDTEARKRGELLATPPPRYASTQATAPVLATEPIGLAQRALPAIPEAPPSSPRLPDPLTVLQYRAQQAREVLEMPTVAGWPIHPKP